MRAHSRALGHHAQRTHRRQEKRRIPRELLRAAAALIVAYRWSSLPTGHRGRVGRSSASAGWQLDKAVRSRTPLFPLHSDSPVLMCHSEAQAKNLGLGAASPFAVRLPTVHTVAFPLYTTHPVFFFQKQQIYHNFCGERDESSVYESTTCPALAFESPCSKEGHRRSVGQGESSKSSPLPLAGQAANCCSPKHAKKRFDMNHPIDQDPESMGRAASRRTPVRAIPP